MSADLPQIYLVRHGETAWSLNGQATGSTDIALSERGEREAQALSKRLQGLGLAKILTSPLHRARRTAELAGFGESAVVYADLAEWDYGAYEACARQTFAPSALAGVCSRTAAPTAKS